MPDFRIGVELGHLIPQGAPLNASSLPRLAQAVKEIAEAAHRQWRAYADGAPLPDGSTISNRTGTYARSIMLRQTGDFSAEVYSDLPKARLIEEGSPARDMKKVLGYSPKVRLNEATGKRYLIIPFRWNHPNSVLGGPHLTESVQSWWADKRSTQVIGSYRRISGLIASDVKTRQQMTAPGWVYGSGGKLGWGDRLTKQDLAGLGVPEKQASRMEGMVNFRKPDARGGASHSKFLTFRVMHEDSSGWIAPAKPGRYPARTTAQQLRPAAERAFGEAVKRDLAALFRSQG